MTAPDVIDLALERSGLKTATDGDLRAALYRLAQAATELRLTGIDRALLDAEAIKLLEARGERQAVKLVEAALALRPGAPRAAPATAAPPTDALTHIRELLAEPDDAVAWIVEGLLPAGGLSVFGGKPKGGKSTTARAIALRVCRGDPVLGRATTRGPVIYLGLEDPRRVTKAHLRTLGARATDDLYVFTGSRPPEAKAWLETLLATVDPVLVVVDTLQHLLGVSDLNDYARVVEALRPVLALVRVCRAHLLLVHHAGKGDRTGFDAILGSTAIVGTVDVALLLRRREDNTRTLTTLQRMGDDLPESVLTLNALQEPQLDGTRADYDARQVEGRVATWLAQQDEPVTRKAVEEGVEGRAEQVRAALYRLVEAKAVTRTGAGAKGDPYLFQRACPVSPDTSGHADMHPKTGQSSPDSATPACPANLGVFDGPLNTGTRIFDPELDARDALQEGA